MYIMIFIISSYFGSFLYWLNTNKLSFRRSHCDNCGHVLNCFDLIPILSYVLLGGKCRYCGVKIKSDYLFWEIIIGLLNCLIYYRYGFSYNSLFLLIFVLIGISLSINDYEEMLIPNYFILLYILLRLISVDNIKILNCFLNGLFISLYLLIIVLISNFISKKEMMGMGDIKLFFALGMYLNIIENIYALLISSTLGLIYCLFRKDTRVFAYGPFICLTYFMILIIK